MDDPGEENPGGANEGETPKNGVLVRGADGALYMLTEEDLQPFKVEEEKAKEIREILSEAPKEVVVRKLASNVIKQLQAISRSVLTSVEVYLPKKE